MDLVNEKNDFAVAFNDFLHHSLKPFLKLSLILRTRYKCSKIKGIYLACLQILRNITVNYLLSYTL